MMIVCEGDWVKVSGKWKQVLKVDPANDIFATLDSDGFYQWWSTQMPEVFGGHLSDIEIQEKLEECGL